MSAIRSPQSSLFLSGKITRASFRRFAKSIFPSAFLMLLISSFLMTGGPSAKAQDSTDLANARLQELANLILPLFQRRLFGSVDGQYTSSRQTIAGNKLKGYSVLNGNLLLRTLGKKADVSAGVYNILDKKYFDPGRPEDVQDALQQNRRSFRIKLTWRFGE